MAAPLERRSPFLEFPRHYRWLAAGFTVLALALITADLAWPDREIDAATVALLAVAFVPWLLPFVKTFKGAGIELEMFARVREEEGRNLEQVAPGGVSVAPDPPLHEWMVPQGFDIQGVTPSGELSAPEWTYIREAVKARSREVYLAHTITPSKVAGQQYDVFISLTTRKAAGLAEVDRAEFFFGRYWGNRVFEAHNINGRIGVATAAYGPFLCVCRVHFTDGYSVVLDRFVDFEMGRIIDALRANA